MTINVAKWTFCFSFVLPEQHSWFWPNLNLAKVSGPDKNRTGICSIKFFHMGTKKTFHHFQIIHALTQSLFFRRCLPNSVLFQLPVELRQIVFATSCYQGRGGGGWERSGRERYGRAPKGEGPEPRKMALKGGAAKGKAPKGRVQNFTFFFCSTICEVLELLCETPVAPKLLLHIKSQGFRPFSIQHPKKQFPILGSV